MFPKIMVPPKSSILIGFSIKNHAFGGTTIFGNTHIYMWFNDPIFQMKVKQAGWSTQICKAGRLAAEKLCRHGIFKMSGSRKSLPIMEASQKNSDVTGHGEDVGKSF